MYLAVIQVKYEIYAIGNTEEEAKTKAFGAYTERHPDHDMENADDLFEQYGGGVLEMIDGVAVQ
jgi:hypothetical protein